jgi:glutamate carboxypeptidase
VPTLDGLGPVCHESCSRAEWVEVASLVTRGAIFASLVADLPESGVAGFTQIS